MRFHYDTQSGFRVAIIGLGSERPVKEFIRLTFANKGDIYLFDQLLPDKDRTELHHHLSLHESGAIYHRSPGKPRERIPKKTLSTPLSERPLIHVLSSTKTTLLEDYFYEGHQTVGLEHGNQIVIWCPYRRVVGSTLRWSIDLINSEDNRIVDGAIRNRFESFTQDGYAYSFCHQGRIVAICMEFSGGMAEVDEQKVRETDAKHLVHHRIRVYDSIQVRG